ncbi:MAG: hypothetical protein NVS3B16_10420 [Vulcanimicrobiaceae bacterium]
MDMWRRFDLGEIREDFERIAGLGLDTVRFFLRWDHFAPQAEGIDPIALERLEAVVASAAAAGLRTVPTFFCGYASGVNWLPAWSLDRNAASRGLRTFSGETESPFRIRDMYRGPLLDAQLLFARAVGERFRAHPAIHAWDLGHSFSNVCEPSSARLASGEHSTEPAGAAEAAQWARRLADALHETSGLYVTAGTHAADLTCERNIRLASLCATFPFASMQGDSVDHGVARSRLDPEAVPFLAMLAATFSYKPVLVSGFGNPTCPPGKFSAFEHFATPDEPPQLAIAPDDTAFATYPCLLEHENAAYCTRVLERLHADGRLGAYWWCWADYIDDLRDAPPFDRAPHERTFGIVRSDGSEKPVAAALAAFARQQRTVVEPADMPMIATTYYYRTLPTSTKTLYDAFLRFVQERRTETA